MRFGDDDEVSVVATIATQRAQELITQHSGDPAKLKAMSPKDRQKWYRTGLLKEGMIDGVAYADHVGVEYLQDWSLDRTQAIQMAKSEWQHITQRALLKKRKTNVDDIVLIHTTLWWGYMPKPEAFALVRASNYQVVWDSRYPDMLMDE
jgi:hypothetical protein